MAPVAYLLGVAWEDCKAIGKLLGTRTVLNELIAFKDLGAIKAQHLLIDRSVVIASFALCGFANISSIGIQLGGIGALVPERRHDLARLGIAGPVRRHPGQLPFGLHRGNPVMTPPALPRSPRPDLYTRAEEAAAVLRAARAEPPRMRRRSRLGLERAGRPARRSRRSSPTTGSPIFPRTTVAGHEGQSALRQARRRATCIVFQGRFHYYEGHDLETVTFPVRVLQQLGVATLILTAATGGIRDRPAARETWCVLTDHLNLIGATRCAASMTRGWARVFPT